MDKIISREIQLKKRPVGMPAQDDFEQVEKTLAQPGEGELLIRNLYVSVDPYMRARMIDQESYLPPFPLGETITGGAVGEVIVSHSDTFKAGDHVLSFAGWREYFVSDGSDLTPVDPAILPVQSFLGVAGMTGLTAYVGLLNIGKPRENDTVYVSAASGAVGSIVCQIAKIKGCRVVGSAGSDEKVDWLRREIGIDGAFNYKQVDNLSAELKSQCPDGIDIYFESVGGSHLEVVLDHMKPFGRIPMCGMISQYNRTRLEPGPANLIQVIGKRLRMQGFIVSDHYDQLPQFQADMAGWIGEGRIKWRETIIEGIENVPKAFLGLFSGDNLGKMLVKVG